MSGYVSIKPTLGAYEEARTEVFGNIGANYSLIDDVIDNPTRIFIINNFTDVPIWISFDGNLNHIAIPAGGHYVQDTGTNGMSLPKGTGFYVKRFSPLVAPLEGSVVVSIGYAVKG